MAKKMDIEEKIARLNALKDVIETTESLRDNAQCSADSYLEQCKVEDESSEDTAVCDTSRWQYKTYEEYMRQVEAYEAIIEALNDMV